MTTSGRIELMASASSFESLQATIINEVESVYCGVGQLNMYVHANINFTLEDLSEILKRCEAKKEML